MRVSCFDLGSSGAVFRAKLEDGVIVPLSCERWSWSGQTDEEKYHQYATIARCEVEWADAVGYEHVQFNRGKSLIEGFRGILVSKAEEQGILCAPINVASLKKFAIKGRWSDKDRKVRGKKPINSKKKMQMALSLDYPQFQEFLDGDGRILPVQGKRDDLIDAAWVCIWLLTTAEVL